MAELAPSYSKTHPPARFGYRQRMNLIRLLVTTFVLAVGVMMIVPFVWTLSTSFKIESEVFSFPIQWIPVTFTTAAYERVFGGMISASRSVPFYRAYLNSFFVSIPGVLGPLVTSVAAGYAFARLEFPGKRIVFLMYLATMIVPEQVLLVPRFMIVNILNIYNTHWALIIPYMITAYGVFLVRQACLSIPQDLFDAAQIDGAGHIGRIMNVVVPNIAPQLGALGMILFVWRWNDYAMPLVMLSRSELFTVPLALATFIETHSEVNYPAMMAATVLGTVPLLIAFIFANRFFVQSAISSAVKG